MSWEFVGLLPQTEGPRVTRWFSFRFLWVCFLIIRRVVTPPSPSHPEQMEVPWAEEMFSAHTVALLHQIALCQF